MRGVNYLSEATHRIVINPLVMSVQGVYEQRSALAQHCTSQPLRASPKHWVRQIWFTWYLFPQHSSAVLKWWGNGRISHPVLLQSYRGRKGLATRSKFRYSIMKSSNYLGATGAFNFTECFTRTIKIKLMWCTGDSGILTFSQIMSSAKVKPGKTTFHWGGESLGT